MLFRSLFGTGGETKLAGETEAIGRIAGFKLGVQLVGGLEERHAQRPSVALEAVAQRGERPVCVHPLAQVHEHLLTRLRAMQGLELGPFRGLRLADELEHDLRKDRALAVETLAGERNVAMGEKMLLDDGFEGQFGMAARHDFTLFLYELE